MVFVLSLWKKQHTVVSQKRPTVFFSLFYLLVLYSSYHCSPPTLPCNKHILFVFKFLACFKLFILLRKNKIVLQWGRKTTNKCIYVSLLQPLEVRLEKVTSKLVERWKIHTEGCEIMKHDDSCETIDRSLLYKLG